MVVLLFVRRTCICYLSKYSRMSLNFALEMRLGQLLEQCTALSWSAGKSTDVSLSYTEILAAL